MAASRKWIAEVTGIILEELGADKAIWLLQRLRAVEGGSQSVTMTLNRLATAIAMEARR